ncbi:MAG: tetratricopeptide repeat protein [Thermoleophilaceae bacterium]
MSVYDVTEQDFMERVVERSREVPVVVDFWAEWCGPCRQLTPALENAARARESQVDLAKLDVDANQMLAQSFRVQGIPAVKAFKDGRVVSEFTGAIPPAQVEKFFDSLVPTEAEQIAHDEQAGEEELRKALELDPTQASAAVRLARMLVARGEDEEARDLLEPLAGDFGAGGLLARIELAEQDESLADAFKAWDEGDHERALSMLEDALHSADDPDRRDLIRRAMVGMFTELGPESDVASRFRRRLAAALN